MCIIMGVDSQAVNERLGYNAKSIILVLQSYPRGLCISDIAKYIGINRLTVMTALAELRGADIADYQKVGPTKLYFLKKTSVGFDA